MSAVRREVRHTGARALARNRRKSRRSDSGRSIFTASRSRPKSRLSTTEAGAHAARDAPYAHAVARAAVTAPRAPTRGGCPAPDAGGEARLAGRPIRPSCGSEAELRRQITYDGSHEEQDPIDDDLRLRCEGSATEDLCDDPARAELKAEAVRQKVKLLLPSAQRLNRGNHWSPSWSRSAAPTLLRRGRTARDAWRARWPSCATCPSANRILHTVQHGAAARIADRAPMSEALRTSSCTILTVNLLSAAESDDPALPVPTPRPDSSAWSRPRTRMTTYRSDITCTPRLGGGRAHGGHPRFEMALYQIRLGTLDQTEADDEWALRPFMNSSKRRVL